MKDGKYFKTHYWEGTCMEQISPGKIVPIENQRELLNQSLDITLSCDFLEQAVGFRSPYDEGDIIAGPFRPRDFHFCSNDDNRISTCVRFDRNNFDSARYESTDGICFVAMENLRERSDRPVSWRIEPDPRDKHKVVLKSDTRQGCWAMIRKVNFRRILFHPVQGYSNSVDWLSHPDDQYGISV